MKLLSFLETQQKKQLVGTLVLGKTSGFRELFFEKDQVFLCASEYSGFVDLRSLEDSGLLGKVVNPNELEAMLSNGELTKSLLPEILVDQGRVDPSEPVDQVARANIHEEILKILLEATDSFTFQESRVPESLLHRGGLTARLSISVDELIVGIRSRLERTELIRTVLPSDDEIFVVTADGMQFKQTHPHDFALQRLLSFVDGLRDLRSLKRACAFYDIHTLDLVVDCLEKEILKKTQIPELKDVSTTALTEKEAEELLPYFKNAVKHSVDQLSARERLAVILEKLGQTEECVVQYNFIGDALYRMKKPAAAIKAYHKALSLNPSEPLIVDKTTRVYLEAAEEQILRGEHMQGAQLLHNALRVNPEDWAAFEKLVGILARAGDHKELAELCTRQTKCAKQAGDPMIAVKSHKIVFQKVENPLPYQRRLVNAYIDFGETKAAATLMKEMIARHLDAADSEKALDLVEKIDRIGEMTPEIAGLRKRLLKDVGAIDPKKRARSRRIAIAGVIAAVFLGYQAWSFVAWNGLNQDSVALAESASSLPAPTKEGQRQKFELDKDGAPLANLAPTVEELQADALIVRCEEFITKFPISLFRSKAAELAASQEERRAALQNQRRQLKDNLLLDADLYLVEGDRKNVEKFLTPLLDLGADHPWYAEASLKLQKLSKMGTSSHELMQRAKKLTEEGKPHEACKLYDRVRKEFPKSQFTKTLEYPVLIESIPSGCYVVRLPEFPNESVYMGQTPFVYKVKPGESFEIELTVFGHHPLRTTIYYTDGRFNLFILFREAMWKEEIAQDNGRDLVVEPVVHGSDVVLARKDGVLEVLDIETKKMHGVLRRGSIYTLTKRPLVTAQGVYSVWNDGTLAFLPVDRKHGRPRAKVEVSLPGQELGLASSPLFALESGEIAVATGRKQIVIFHPTTLAVVRKVPIPIEAHYLSSHSPKALIAASNSGEVIVVETANAKIVWRRSLNMTLERAPERIGGPVLVMATIGDPIKKRRLHVLESETGVDKIPAIKVGEEDHVEFDVEGGVVYVLNADRELATLSPELLAVGNGGVLQHRKFQIEITRLLALGGALGVLHQEGRSFLALDSKTLEPLWAARSPDPYTSLHPTKERLVTLSSEGVLNCYLRTRTVPDAPLPTDSGAQPEPTQPQPAQPQPAQPQPAPTQPK